MSTEAPTTQPLPSLAISLDAETVERLADAVADRLAARLSPQTDLEQGWLDTAAAARYLGRTPNAVHRLASEDRIPCSRPAGERKLWFQRSRLDEWMLEDRREPRF